MANIFDYLIWRADVPFSVSPFNPVDNLVLSELAYADLDGVVGEEEMALTEVYERYFSLHDRKEVEERTTYTGHAPLLMDEMVKGARFRDMRLSRYESVTDTERDFQFAAITFSLPDDSIYVAYRGTDGTIVGWKEDFNLCYMKETEGQSMAVRYLDRLDAEEASCLRVGGHSKGGNLAAFAAAFCQKEIQDRIEEIYSNDGPGFLDEVIQSEGYQKILPRIISIVPETSIIGVQLSSPAKKIVVDSSARGIVQHDGNTWLVERDHFVTAPQSETSLYVEQVFGRWMGNMDEQERITFVDTIFSTLEATGVERFRDIAGQKRKSIESIFQAIKDMPKEQQQEFRHIMGSLLQTGGQTLWNKISAIIS